MDRRNEVSLYHELLMLKYATALPHDLYYNELTDIPERLMEEVQAALSMIPQQIMNE